MIIAWLSVVPSNESYDDAAARPLSPAQQKFANAAGFEDAYDAILGNCSMCHAREPVYAGIFWAPKGVFLETRGDVVRYADKIYVQSGISHAMPPPNSVQMDQQARGTIVAWYRAATGPLTSN